MMSTTIAVAKGVTAAGEVEETTVTGVQMMTGVQGITMSRLDLVRSGPKLLLIPPHRHREVPSQSRRPTRQLLDQMLHSLRQ